MKSYPHYIDSRQDWLGKIPSHWQVIRSKFVVSILSGYAFDSSLFTYDETDMPLIRIRDISNNKTEVYYKGKYSDKHIIKNNDVIIGMDGDFNIEHWRGEDALLNQRVCKIENGCILNKDYAYYLLIHPLKLINDVTYSTTVKHLAPYDIYNLYIPLPPPAEQEAIVNYLDAETAKIDAQIQRINREIELLEEYKQSIITEVVTGKRCVCDFADSPIVYEPAEPQYNIAAEP